MTTSAGDETRARMEATIRRYFDGCNAADVDLMAACFTPEAVHYAFDPDSLLITEIRAYYASPQAAGLSRLELEGFPYAERGYHLSCPVPRPALDQGTRS